MAQWKDKSRKHWLYQFKFKAQRHTGRGFVSRSAARAAEMEHRQQLKLDVTANALIPQTGGTGFKEVAYEYLDDAQRRFAKKTYEFKVLVCDSFMEHLGGDLLIGEITFKHVKEYLKTRPSNHNWNAHRKDLHTVFEFAKKYHYVSFNPVGDVDKLPHTPAKKNLPSAELVVKMINTCNPETERPLFLAVLHTLGRVDELLRLAWDDVDFERTQLTLWTRKRKDGALEADSIPMNKELARVMADLYKKRTQDNFVFLNPKTKTRFNRRPKFMKSVCKRIFDPKCKRLADYTGPKYNFHDLRHFMASFLAAKGKGSLKDLQRLLRHKESRTTEIYLHQLSDNLRSVVEDAEVFKVDVPGGCDSDE